MVMEIRTAALQMLSLIAYVTKLQTGSLWICDIYHRFPEPLNLSLRLMLLVLLTLICDRILENHPYGHA